MNTKNVEITIPTNSSAIYGDLHLVDQSKSIVIFAHGSGSSRFSKRNKFVADILHQSHLSTLLFDLLTPEEDSIDQHTSEFRFDIQLLTQRLLLVTQWIQKNKEISSHKIGYFGASTGAAASLIAGAQLTQEIFAIVSRGGRPDLATDDLPAVTAPTLLIVGELDYEVIQFNRKAFAQLTCKKKLSIIPGATHLFEEGNTLELAAHAAANWFVQHE